MKINDKWGERRLFLRKFRKSKNLGKFGRENCFPKIVSLGEGSMKVIVPNNDTHN